MPRITNPRGTAIINTGFITLLFQTRYEPLDIGRGRGLNREYVRCRIRAEVHANAGRVDRPSTSCAPLQLSPLPNKLTIRGGDYCLILNNVEKNYRCKSGSRFRGSS